MKTPREKLIPNSTQIPNVLMDLVMPRIQPAQERCLRYICRRTFGFGKKADRIGLSQFEKGIKSSDTGEQLDYGAGLPLSTIREALEDLDAAGIVTVDRSKNGKTNGYRINLDLDPEEAVRKCREAWTRRNKSKELRKVKPLQASLFASTDPAAGRHPVARQQGPCRTGSKDPAALATIQNKVETKLQNKVAGGAPAPNRFLQFLDWYADLAKRTRSLDLPIKITKAGKSNLGRFLAEKKPSWELLEQLALYFLAHHSFKKYGPGLETFLSAGIMNGLLNAARNDASFWKDLDSFAERFLRKESSSRTYTQVDMQSAVAAMLARMKVSAPADLEIA